MDRLLYFDGILWAELMRAGLTQLALRKEHINMLNVFPIPDGDTGTNMLLTMRSACDKLAIGETAAGVVAQSAARGALLGARGNSGVILSQIWRGVAEVVGESSQIDGVLFAQALRHAAEIAYQSVTEPVEGTILTIIRAMADSAETSLHTHTDLHTIITNLVTDSNIALAYTPEQLPILKQAGVVDSGGQGLVCIFEGMLHWLNGDLTETDMQSQASAHPQTITAQQLARPADGVLEFPYDVQFILYGTNLDQVEILRQIDSMGDSTLVVGDSTLIKVHVHVADPGLPLSYAATLGAIDDVVVENMQAQMEAIIGGDSRPNPAHILDQQTTQIGIVAVAAGAGVADIFHSLGVSVVVEGGQTNNPSTAELLAAIDAVESEQVIVLPNNKNIMLAAQAAAELSAKVVTILPSHTIPQGIGALIAFDANAEFGAVVDEMVAAIADVMTGQVTQAVRAVELDGVAVACGQWIGIVDGKLVSAAETLLDLMRELLITMALETRDLIALYYGVDVSEQAAQLLAADIIAQYPDIEVELVNGGQPHYAYLLGIE